MGERIRVDKTVHVIGVLESKGSMFGHNEDDILLMYETLADCMGVGAAFTLFCIGATREGIEQARKDSHRRA